MSWETARSILNREFKIGGESGETDEILFDFLGGEPFLEFPLIRRLVEWTWSAERPLPFLFSATTNGTVLDEDAKSWLRDHADRFKVVLSLDGARSVQETTRPKSADRIDIDFFRDVYADQPLKMTVAPDTVGQFAEGVVHLVEEGFSVAPSFAYGVDWEASAINEYARQLLLLANWFHCHPDKEPIPQLCRRLAPVLERGPIRRTCGTGRMMVTYDVDGSSYPCHLFLPWISGRKTGFASVYGDSDLCDGRCRSCSYLRICKHCYGFNFFERGDPAIRSETNCRLMQAEIAACICYKGTCLSEKVRYGHSLDAEELIEARAILHLHCNPPIDITSKRRTAKS